MLNLLLIHCPKGSDWANIQLRCTNVINEGRTIRVSNQKEVVDRPGSNSHKALMWSHLERRGGGARKTLSEEKWRQRWQRMDLEGRDI